MFISEWQALTLKMIQGAIEDLFTQEVQIKSVEFVEDQDCEKPDVDICVVYLYGNLMMYVRSSVLKDKTPLSSDKYTEKWSPNWISVRVMDIAQQDRFTQERPACATGSWVCNYTNTDKPIVSINREIKYTRVRPNRWPTQAT